MNAKQVIKNVQLTAAQAKQIVAAEKQVEALHEIVLNTSADRDFHPSRLHAQADAAMDAFCENPSLEAAEAYHAAKVRCEQAKLSAEQIGEAVYVKLHALGQSLAPIALDVLAKAEAQVQAQLETALEAAKADASIFDGAEAIRKQAADLLASIAQERHHAQQDPLRFLVNNGFSAAMV